MDAEKVGKSFQRSVLEIMVDGKIMLANEWVFRFSIQIKATHVVSYQLMYLISSLKRL